MEATQRAPWVDSSSVRSPGSQQCRRADVQAPSPGSRHRRALGHSQEAGPKHGDQIENRSQKWLLSGIDCLLCVSENLSRIL